MSSKSTFQDQLVPTVPADKMLFGIIPGCTKLGFEDYHILGDDYKPRLDVVFDSLDLDYETRSLLSETPTFYTRCPVNDILALVSQFVPKCNSPIARTFHPILWNTTAIPDIYACVFHFWEGRTWLFCNMQKEWKTSEDSYEILDLFKAFERTFEDHFHGRWENSPIRFRKEGNQQRIERLRNALKMLQMLRELHSKTTTYFESLESLQPFNYRQLVGAHINMATKAVINAEWEEREAEDQRSKRYSSEGTRHSKGPQDDNVCEKLTPRHGPVGRDGIYSKLAGQRPFLARMFRIAECYTNGLDEIARTLSTQYRADEDSIKDAWWVLIVRGMCWDMSLWMTAPDADSQLLPSSFYGSRVPVWIM